MIDGLKLTFSGEELRALLEERTRAHEARADRWAAEVRRTGDDDSEDAPLLPTHMCEYELERHTWRASVLAFVRAHVEAGERYRLSAADLEYGELLPERPGAVTQEEYEHRTGIAFNLERLVKSVDRLAACCTERFGAALSAADEIGGNIDGFRASRMETDDGLEIIKIERE